MQVSKVECLKIYLKALKDGDVGKSTSTKRKARDKAKSKNHAR